MVNGNCEEIHGEDLVMKKFALIMTVFAFFWPFASACAADSESLGEIVEATKLLRQATRSFQTLMNVGNLGQGRFVSSYAQLNIDADVLAGEVERLQPKLRKNVTCKSIQDEFSTVSDQFTNLNEALQNVQSEFYRSDISRSWRRVKTAYEKLRGVLWESCPSPNGLPGAL